MSVQAIGEVYLSPSGFPLRLENLEKWEGIFQSGNFEQAGKVGESQGKSHKILENREFQTNVICYILIKKYWKMGGGGILEKSG